MASLKIYSEVLYGKLSDLARNTISHTLRSMEGKEVEIVIKEKKRSLSQNRYRWGVVNQTIMLHLNDYLEKMGLPTASPEDIDIFIKDKALGLTSKIDTPLGEIIISGKLREKTTQDFEESMECIRSYFAQKGLIIPLPNEDLEK